MQRHTSRSMITSLLLMFMFMFMYCTRCVTINQKFTSYQSSISNDSPIIDKQVPFLQLQNPHKNVTFIEDNLYSNMIIANNYALVGKTSTVLTGILKRLNFQTMKLQTFIYQRPYYTLSGNLLHLGNPKNGYIFVGDGKYLYVLHNETLKLKQTLIGNQSITDIITYSQSTVCFVKRGSNIMYQLMFNSSSNKFEQILRTYDYQAPFDTFLTGQNTAVTINTIRGCEVSYWDNIRPIVEISYDRKDYLLERINVAVGSSQSLLVVKNQKNYLYQFYTIDDNIQISLNDSILLDYNTHKKGAITNDESTLFVSTTKSTKNYVAKIDIKTKLFQFVSDQQGNSDNQLDFTLFDYRHNRFVTLSMRSQTNYYLQLWSIDNLTMLDQYFLKSEMSVLDYKLVGSTQWGLSFALATKISKERIQNDSIIYLYTIQQDKIINLNIEKQVSFQLISACYQYVVTNKKGNQNMKILHYSNFSVAAQIYSKNINDENGVIIQKNFMILTQYFGACQIYNFEQSLQLKGIINKESQRRIFDNYISILLPSKGIIYQSMTKQYSNTQVTKAVYNISIPSIKKCFKIDGEVPCTSAKYFSPENTANDCNYIFYVQIDKLNTNHKLVQYSECSNQSVKYVIAQNNEGLFASLHISSDKKYITILDYLYPTADLLLFQVRLMSNLSHIVYEQIRSQKNVLSIGWYNVDLINDTMIVIHSTDYMSVIYIQPSISQTQTSVEYKEQMEQGWMRNGKEEKSKIKEK